MYSRKPIARPEEEIGEGGSGQMRASCLLARRDRNAYSNLIPKIFPATELESGSPIGAGIKNAFDTLSAG
jgi:hypothetical protein